MSQEECTCTPCSMCDGSGTVWYGIGGRFLGARRCDDLDTLESCEECGGTGVEIVCGPCLDAEQREIEDREARGED